MKLVEGAEVVDEVDVGLGQILDAAMDDDVEHGKEAEANVAEVRRQVLAGADPFW